MVISVHKCLPVLIQIRVLYIKGVTQIPLAALGLQLNQIVTSARAKESLPDGRGKLDQSWPRCGGHPSGGGGRGRILCGGFQNIVCMNSFTQLYSFTALLVDNSCRLVGVDPNFLSQ